MNRFEAKLSDIHSDEIDEVLARIEDAFGFAFVGDELKNVQTFGQLCEVVKTKINLEAMDDCTSQQAFYRLRSAIVKTAGAERRSLKPGTLLEEIFPHGNRRKNIRKAEALLGFNTRVMGAHELITAAFGLGFVLSFIYVFINWKVALCFMGLCIFIMGLAERYGRILKVKTLGEWAEWITAKKYLKARSNPGTYNPNEIELVIRKLFMDQLGLSKDALQNDARFVRA